MAVLKNATIELSLTYNRLLLLGWLGLAPPPPTVGINGKKERREWGIHRLELPPDTYEVSISYPTEFLEPYGSKMIQVTLEPGEVRRIRYHRGHHDLGEISLG